ncbi:MAG TPA: AMP-binding protein [Planctomycetota bacterium]|nr:AMP-binding protein [Planctomycetota bacterium]
MTLENPYPFDPERATLRDAMLGAARLSPTRGITILDRRGQNPERRMYPQLLEMARRGAARLSAIGIQPRDRLLVCLQTSWDLLEIWFGAILCDAYPVLVAPPAALGGAAAHARKIEGLVELLNPRRLICDGALQIELVEFGAPTANSICLTSQEFAGITPSDRVPEPPVTTADLAFLQLTSGSTGRQRAVQIRHANVIHNARAMAEFSKVKAFTDADAVVSWLPLNHDMGLVGCLLYSLIHGINLFLMRPDTFLARPKLWLQTISANRATMAAAPNFAYQLCIERLAPADLDGLDLSSWRVALTGAEMVHPQTCRLLCEKFKNHKFQEWQLLPSFGMAEATLAVTADRKRVGVRTRPMPAGSERGLGFEEVVCLGSSVIDTDVKISSLSKPGEFLNDDALGEVWVKGPSVFAGYYNDPAATAETLHEGKWLRTGDIGFLIDGELYITGRTKDVLIIHGHNLMPHELEWLAESVSGGGGSERSGAFSVTRGSEGEQAVLVVEVGSVDAAQLQTAGHEIRTRVARALGLPLADLVFVKRGQIPKTTSGKVQRRELRQRYLDGRLERLG